MSMIGAPKNNENMKLLNAWARAEGGTAEWNPLNCVMDQPGATDYNSIHVKNYPRPTWGVCAQAMTLTNGLYNGILGDLQAGKYTAQEIVHRNTDEFIHWGTGTDLLLRVLG